MDHRTELRVLVELDRAGNARRAADALGVSQSTLSDAVARMERAYGAALFDRDQRGTRATVCGRIVVDAAARSLEILDNAHREADLLGSGERATLAIGADPALVEAYVVPTIAAILEDHVSLQIRVHNGSPDDLLRLLRERHIELFLGFRPDGPLTGVRLETVGALAGVPFARIGHPLAAVPPQGIRVLRDFPFVATHMPRWYHERLLTELPHDAAMEHLADQLRLIELEDYGAVRALVKSSNAVAIAPYETIRADVEAGQLAVLGVPDDQAVIVESTPIVVATLDDRALPPIAPIVVEALKAQVVAASS